MNVYQEGSGKDTFVFMSGSGIAAPAYEIEEGEKRMSKQRLNLKYEVEIHGLIELFFSRNRIILIE